MSFHRCGLSIATLLAVLAATATAEAVPRYVSRVPTSFSCTTCHTSSSGGRRNVFGNAFSSKGYSWAGICNLDSDGDGFTNGEELGDPDCTWRAGDRVPAFNATRPADPNDFPMTGLCGNGVTEPGEACDGTLPSSASCESEGRGAGALNCNDDCTFNLTACGAAMGGGTGGTGIVFDDDADDSNPFLGDDDDNSQGGEGGEGGEACSVGGVNAAVSPAWVFGVLGLIGVAVWRRRG